jgi:pyrroloquinoline quinone biosynthesis protein E
MNAVMPTAPFQPPMALIMELTHRCPLQCPYCSNPLALDAVRDEIPTEIWLRVIDEAAALGVLQAHFTGGEPMSRRDLPGLVHRAAKAGMYTNIITSGVTLDDRAMAALKSAGVDHIQLSFQDIDPRENDRVGGYEGAFAKKRAAADRIRGAGLPLTLNFVIQRHNVSRVAAMIAFAEELGAERVEIAHVQYYGWGLRNRAALLPTRAQLEDSTDVVEAARERLRGKMVIDYVVPDYHAARPKSCMGGWAQRTINISPAGKALPCHAAETLPGFTFPNVRHTSLADVWNSEPFRRYRGTAWMPEPCRSCDRRELDWGGCRCQAFAITGNAGVTDPACELSPLHHLMGEAAEESASPAPAFVYRRMGERPGALPLDPAKDKSLEPIR